MNDSRNHFRIRFPQDQRPRLYADGVEYAVLNLSESGASVLASGAGAGWKSVVPVRVVLGDGTACETTASMLREMPRELIVRFEKWIPQSLIVAEQRRLIRLYPKDALRDSSPEERK